MCTYNTKFISSPSLLRDTGKPKSKRIQKRLQIRFHCKLNRENYRVVEEKNKREMELKNLKLYMENMNILKENEKLRKKASQLHQENLVLLSQIENFSSLQGSIQIRERQAGNTEP